MYRLFLNKENDFVHTWWDPYLKVTFVNSGLAICLKNVRNCSLASEASYILRTNPPFVSASLLKNAWSASSPKARLKIAARGFTLHLVKLQPYIKKLWKTCINDEISDYDDLYFFNVI